MNDHPRQCRKPRPLRAALRAAALTWLAAASSADRAGGQEKAAVPAAKPAVIWGLKFSPDGKSLAAATSVSAKEGGTIVVWDVADGRPRLVHFAENGGADVAFSPDGKLLAFSTWGPRVGILDVSSDKPVRAWTAHEGKVPALVFSADGKLLATAGMDRTIKLWDVATGERKQTLEGHGGAVEGVAFSPDGAMLLSGGMDSTARLWDLTTGKECRSFQPNQFIVRRVSFSSDGRFFLTSRWDGRVRIQEAASGQLRAVFRGGSQSAALSADNGLLITSGWGAAHVYRTDLRPLSAEREAEVRKLIRRWEDDDYQVREAATREIGLIGLPAEPLLREAMKSPLAEVRLRARRLRQKIMSPDPSAELTGHAGEVEVVAISPSGDILATGCRGGEVKVWESKTFREVITLRPPRR